MSCLSSKGVVFVQVSKYGCSLWVLKWDTESKHSIYETNCVTVSLICIEDTENESSGISHEESWGAAHNIHLTISLLYENIRKQDYLLPFQVGQQLDFIVTMVIHQTGDGEVK